MKRLELLFWKVAFIAVAWLVAAYLLLVWIVLGIRNMFKRKTAPKLPRNSTVRKKKLPIFSPEVDGKSGPYRLRMECLLCNHTYVIRSVTKYGYSRCPACSSHYVHEIGIMKVVDPKTEQL